MKGRRTNASPPKGPKNGATGTGPKYLRKPGNRVGSEFTTRTISTGSALSLHNSDPPEPGPHDKLCLPINICQLFKFTATYASSNRGRLIAATGVAGGSGTKSRRAMMLRTAPEGAGDSGAC